jgi:organic radical activating enzyme
MQHLFSRFLAKPAGKLVPAETPVAAPATPVALPPLNIRYYTDYPTCNLACSYCVAGHGTTFQKPPTSRWDPARYRRVMANVAKLPYAVNIRIGVGGEFFVSKDLVDGARLLSQSPNLHALNLITNLTLSVAQFEKTFQGFDESKIAMVASFHPEQIKDHADWFDKAAEFSGRYDFAVIMVAFPEALDIIAAHKASLNARGVDVFIQPFVGPHKEKWYPQAYSDAEREQIKAMIYSRHDYEYLLNAKRPGACNAGYRAIFIDPMGIVTPCGMGKYHGSLGNLAESPDLALRDGPAPCPFSSCQCDTENVNTVEFHTHYEKSGANQHRYRYRFGDLAALDDRYDEWKIHY